MRSWLGSLSSDHLAQKRLNWPPSGDGAMIFWSMRSRMAWLVLWVLHDIVGIFLVHWEIWWWKNWAFLKLILRQLGLILMDLWAMILDFWLPLWNNPFCQFWAQSYCMYLDSLIQWTVSFKFGPYFTKSHGWTIGFGALIQWGPKS